MDISIFSHDLSEYFSGRRFFVELCLKNGFVYVFCNQIYADDLSFCERYGLFLLSVRATIRDDFNLEVCLVPRK